LIDAARSLFVPAGASSPERNRAVGRHRIVRLVDEHLCANPVRPIYTDDLCLALGVSASALREAFHAVFGISPHRYLKLRRMSLARAALLSSSGPWHSVKAAALSHGFWHLGQFAQDYREIYGELPSATLARGRPDVRG
jgi:AraC family ethanolamine operon transcriptional activator